MEISGKVAVVTGGASGLGAATAKMIVEEGGHVVIVDLNDEVGHALAKDLGSHARFVRADVSDPAEAQGAVETAMDAFGALHISVQCAGIADAQNLAWKLAVALRGGDAERLLESYDAERRSAICRATRSSGTTRKLSPASGTLVNPST